MKMDKSKIKKILVVSLTNIGDVILTFPVVDILKREFPLSEISIVVGPKSKSLFDKNKSFSSVYVFDKHQSMFSMARWVWGLRKNHFDFVIDLRNTAIGFFLTPKYRTPFHGKQDNQMHMKEKHLNCLEDVFPFEKDPTEKKSLLISDSDKQYVKKIILEEIGKTQKYIVVAPGAADEAKRWGVENFAELCDVLFDKYGFKIVFVGSEEDKDIVQQTKQLMKNDGADLSGRVDLLQLSELLKNSELLIGNDSAPMHLASYLDVPVVAIFGPTDPLKYGPWSHKSIYVLNRSDCLACNGQKELYLHKCMEGIAVKDVLEKIEVTEKGLNLKTA